jgi:hypothetical protein
VHVHVHVHVHECTQHRVALVSAQFWTTLMMRSVH